GARGSRVPRRLPLVLEAEHGASRKFWMSRLHVIPGGGRRGLQMQHRDARHDRKNAAVATENAIVDLVSVDLVEQRRDEIEASAAVGTAQEVERRGVHG